VARPGPAPARQLRVGRRGSSTRCARGREKLQGTLEARSGNRPAVQEHARARPCAGSGEMRQLRPASATSSAVSNVKTRGIWAKPVGNLLGTKLLKSEPYADQCRDRAARPARRVRDPADRQRRRRCAGMDADRTPSSRGRLRTADRRLRARRSDRRGAAASARAGHAHQQVFARDIATTRYARHTAPTRDPVPADRGAVCRGCCASPA